VHLNLLFPNAGKETAVSARSTDVSEGAEKQQTDRAFLRVLRERRGPIKSAGTVGEEGSYPIDAQWKNALIGRRFG